MAATSWGWPVVTRYPIDDQCKKNSDTHSRWVSRTHLQGAQKWRRVAFATALSQGGIRRKPRQPPCSEAPARPYYVSSRAQLRELDSVSAASRNETSNIRRCPSGSSRLEIDQVRMPTVPQLPASHSQGAAILPLESAMNSQSQEGPSLSQFPARSSSLTLPASLVLDLRIAKVRDTALVDPRRPPKVRTARHVVKFRFASRRTKQVAETEPGET